MLGHPGHLLRAGTVGGALLGDLAIRYRYQRFRPDVMAATVVVLVTLARTLQAPGDRLARTLDRRAPQAR